MTEHAAPRPGPPALLVIDDDPASCEVLSAIARRAGFEPRMATDASRLEAMLAPEVKAVVLDLQMPGVDGIEVLRRLVALGCSARVILVSGVDAPILRSAFQLGEEGGLDMAGRLQKPVRAAELLALLRDPRPGKAGAGARDAPPRESAERVRHAIESGEMTVFLQPQADLRTGSIAGAEALVRWRHPERGLLLPGHFIATVEDAALGLALTEAVVEAALRAWDACARDGLDLPEVSVNLPPEALTDTAFPDRVEAALARHGLPPHRFVFELTETSIARDTVAALDILTRLRLKGTRLAVDDFGVGYSSLELLRRLPFTELKIDRQFVAELPTSASAAAIVRNSIALARDLGLRVLAEGVESEAAWWRLSDLGCDLAQGYLVGRPMPPSGMAAWLSSWRPPAR
ncbi:MAG: EAL domain-containing response regulator [Betaproteobacteria bacterium]|nr:EAL domain-containing response regulator [Betaproteobacteria bacterium]